MVTDGRSACGGGGGADAMRSSDSILTAVTVTGVVSTILPLPCFS